MYLDATWRYAGKDETQRPEIIEEDMVEEVELTTCLLFGPHVQN